MNNARHASKKKKKENKQQPSSRLPGQGMGCPELQVWGPLCLSTLYSPSGLHGLYKQDALNKCLPNLWINGYTDMTSKQLVAPVVMTQGVFLYLVWKTMHFMIIVFLWGIPGGDYGLFLALCLEITPRSNGEPAVPGVTPDLQISKQTCNHWSIFSYLLQF